MDKIQKIKGFADLFAPESDVFSHIERTAARVFALYGYREARIPLLERTELFARSIGTETDVVQKEMYTFPDRKGRSLTLRPEATAGLLRAYVEQKLCASEGVAKLFAHGPMFRYERPQKGRMRQFHQVDVEALGSPEPALDAEMLIMLDHFLADLGITNTVTQLNSLGCRQCRPIYLDALRDFLRGMHKEKLCEDCLRRKLINPLRVLDCKVPGCRELTLDAPKITDYLCPDCLDHFDAVKGLLDAAGMAYELAPRLVRGLDYYVRTTFEIVSGDIGAQSSIAGGGRYDGLVADLGGPDTPGIGFACGMERLALLVSGLPDAKPDFDVAILDPAALEPALLMVQSLRRLGYRGETPYRPGCAKSGLRRAGRLGARLCLILGETELVQGMVQIKDLADGAQSAVPMDALADFFTARIGRPQGLPG
jgi:histidyl-tRNA synthetase